MMQTTDHDRRISEWLEEGAQNVPDWLVEASLQQAHDLPQVGTRLRLPWATWPRRRWVSPQVMISMSAGALGALAVLAAFGLGLISSQLAVDPAASPSPSIIATPPASSGVDLRRPIGALEVIDLLPDDVGEFYTLSGLATTRDALWTVAVYEEAGSSTVVNVLVRVDLASGAARVVPIADSSGLLSPPVARDDTVWTASDEALHRLDANDEAVTTLPLDFDPAEIALGDDGLWVARPGGSALVDTQTGTVLRDIDASGLWGTRILGAVEFGTLWACTDGNSVVRLDPLAGQEVGEVPLAPAVSGGCRGAVEPLRGVAGLEDGVVPGQLSVIIDPTMERVTRRFETPFRWADFIVIDGVAWLALRLDGEERQIGLAPLDPVTGRVGEILTLGARFHDSAAFESRLLASAGGYLWLLADGRPGDPGTARPSIVRIPLSELR